MFRPAKPKRKIKTPESSFCSADAEDTLLGTTAYRSTPKRQPNVRYAASDPKSTKTKALRNARCIASVPAFVERRIGSARPLIVGSPFEFLSGRPAKQGCPFCQAEKLELA